MTINNVKIETLLAKGFWEPNDIDGVVPPIITSTTFPPFSATSFIKLFSSSAFSTLKDFFFPLSM